MPQPPVLYPPLRFATVEEGIYRGAYPTLRNFRYLRRLRLRTVVSLAPMGATADLEEWCEAEEAQLVHHRTVPAAKGEPLSLTAATAAAVLSVLIDPQQLPVYLFCVDGVEATGVVVMCLRKLQNWALSAAFAEYLRFSSDVAMPEALERFVSAEFGAGAEPRNKKEASAASSDRQSLLSLDSSLDESSVGAVVVRETVPAWLWGGLRSPALLHAALAHQADQQQQQQGADAAAAAGAASSGNTSATSSAVASTATTSGLGSSVDPAVLAEPATAAAAVAAAAAAAASGGKPHPSVRLRHVPPLFAFDHRGLLNLVDSQQRLGLSVAGAHHHHHHHGGVHGSGPHVTKSGGRSHDAALTMVPGKMTAVKRSEMMIGDSVKLRKPTSSSHRSGAGSSSSSGGGIGSSASGSSGAVSGSGSGLDLFSLNQSGAFGSDASSSSCSSSSGGSSSGGSSSDKNRVRGASNDAAGVDSVNSKNVFGAASLDGMVLSGGSVGRGGPSSNSGSADGALDHSSRSGRSGGGGAGDTGSRDGSEQWSESGSRGGGGAGLDDGDGFGSNGGGSGDDDDDGSDDGGDSGGEYDHHLSPGGSFRRSGHRRGPEDHSQQFIRDFSDRALAQQQQQSGGVGALQDGSLLSSAVVLDPQSFGAMATGGGVVVRRIQGGGANGSAGFVTADGRPLDNRMRLSRSLRALDLDGLEENLTQRNISAHWDLENSRWQAEKED